MQETYLTFVEGTSSKFWRATLSGATLTVNWGKIGTAGQSQEKIFGSDAEAEAALSKQKAEKLKKGYVENDAAATPVSAAPASTPKAKATPVASEPTPAVPARTERRLNLKPEDYNRIGWLPRSPVKPRPPVKPFDKAECYARLNAACGEQKNNYSYWSWKWDKLRADHSLSREEAHFWLEVCRAISTANDLAGIKNFLEKKTFDGSFDLNSVPNIHIHWAGLGQLFCEAVWILHGPAMYISFIAGQNDWQALQKSHLVETELLPRLNETERAEFAEATAAQLAGAKTPPIWLQRLGAVLATDPIALRESVASWPDGSARPHFNPHWNDHVAIVLGVGDPELAAAELRRTDALPTSADDIRLILAATGLRCLDRIAESICQITDKTDAEKMARALLLAEGPETASALAKLAAESKVPHLAREWWEKFPHFAIVGLAPLLSEKSRRGEIALEWLRGYKKRGGTPLIEEALKELPESLTQAVREKVLAATDDETVEPLTEAETPDWVKAVFGGELIVPDATAEENPPRKLAVTESDRPAPLPPLGPPLPMPPTPPFDLDACWAKLAVQFNGRHWTLHKLQLPFPLSKEEAHFWLEAAAQIAQIPWNQTLAPQALEAGLRKISFSKDIDKKRLISRAFPGAVPALWTLFGADGIFALITHQNNVKNFDKQLLPYLTEAERGEIAAYIPEAIRKQGKNIHQFTGYLSLMEQLRFTPTQFAEAIQHLKGEISWWHGPQYLMYLTRLSDPAAIVALAGALNAYPRDEVTGRKWLASTGWAGLPGLTKMQEYSYYDKGESARLLALVEAPEVARHLVALRRFPSAKTVARGWLERLPAFAVEGLAPLLVEKDKKAVDLATDYLRELKRKGYGWLIEKKLASFDAAVQAALKARVLDYDPRRERAATPKDAALATLLPPVKVRTESGVRRLTEEQMKLLIAELRATPLDQPSPSLELVRQSAEPLSLDSFVWALFDDWLQEGAPSKERWRIESLGHLGGDSVALKLTPLIRAWPGESQHARAVVGLDCLRAIGTDTALMQINGIAQKVPFKAIKERAKECMDAIAADRGFSPAELSDRIIPDGGLDERGTREFDFGPRTFFFALGPDLKPAIKDETGKRLPDLPKPNAKDDADLAAEAMAAWKLLKKQVAEVAKTQVGRLEQAMVLGRRWSPSEFTQLLVEHPLMGLLVQRLIWAAYDTNQKPLGSFRVNDDRSLSDETDAAWAIPESAVSIGIVHPSHLTAVQQSAWGEILSDYEILPPFVQLGRPTFSVTDDEKKQPYLSRFGGIKLDPKTLVFGLDNLSWQRGAAQDGGSFSCHHKIFGEIVAVVTYEEGVWVGDNGDSWEPQAVTGIGFTRDKRAAEDGWFSWDYNADQSVPLSEIDPVVLSEVIYDVTRLVEKGRKS